MAMRGEDIAAMICEAMPDELHALALETRAP